MVDYEVTVYTTNYALAATFDNVYIKLVGSEGESNRTWLYGIIGSLALFKGEVSLELKLIAHYYIDYISDKL